MSQSKHSYRLLSEPQILSKKVSTDEILRTKSSQNDDDGPTKKLPAGVHQYPASLGIRVFD